MGLIAVDGLRLCEGVQQSIPKHNASHNITIPKTGDSVIFSAHFPDARARLDVMSALHDTLASKGPYRRTCAAAKRGVCASVKGRKCAIVDINDKPEQ